MYKLSSFFKDTERDGEFSQTQFSNTSMSKSLCFIGKEQYLHQANKNDNVSAVIVSNKLANKVEPEKGLVVTDDPELSFYKLHNELHNYHNMNPAMPFGRGDNIAAHPTAIISEKTYIGSNVKIGPGAIIEDYCFIEDNVAIESGAIVGSAGHYYKNFHGRHFRVEHAGGVKLSQGVQILAGAVVSRSLHTDYTTVGEDSIISVKAHVGHGCQIGKRCVLTGNVQVSGFTRLGDDVWVGPSATIGNLLSIGSGSRIETGSVVVKNLPKDSRVSGNFAWEHRANVREYTKRLRLG
ncbi:MAG: hypothetical protein KUG71_07440 [Porticoccaceae bacterium]|nr:hypothetical protein [Porticoccaceae bacterium]